MKPALHSRPAWTMPCPGALAAKAPHHDVEAGAEIRAVATAQKSEMHESDAHIVQRFIEQSRRYLLETSIETDARGQVVLVWPSPTPKTTQVPDRPRNSRPQQRRQA